MINVIDFGAVGDGVANDTSAIQLAIASGGKSIYFPEGVYLCDGGLQLPDGVSIFGDGRNASTIRSNLSSPTNGYIIQCNGYGSGIRRMRFDAAATQTGGSYIHLSGVESFIDDFHMTGDYNGVLMTGVVARVRHGRFQDAAPGAIRIRAEGGDTSQAIDDVLMGAQSPPNIAAAGIRVRNSSALIINNTSVINQGVGLLINPTSAAENVFSMYVDTCFFDNGTNGIKITPTGTGKVLRSKFANVWASSSTGDGVLMYGPSANSVDGIDFKNLQANLNGGSGISTGGGIRNASFLGGNVSANAFGFYFNNAFQNLRIQSMDVGNSDGFGVGNTNADMVFAVAGFTGAIITGNVFSSTTKAVGLANVTASVISGNIGI